MYLRSRSLEGVLATVKELFSSGSIVSGQFLKVGTDTLDNKTTCWVFAPDEFSEVKHDEDG